MKQKEVSTKIRTEDFVKKRKNTFQFFEVV